MGTFLANWQDEEKNRNIQFSVSFTERNGDIEITDIVPSQVTFVCPETNTCLKTTKVYTEKGRQLLANQIRKSPRIEKLKHEILDRRASLANA